MKKVYHILTSVTLAIIVLVSTSSFTISQHYCFGRLVETSVFTANIGCSPKKVDGKKQSCDTILKKTCCDDKHFVVEGIDDLKFENYTFNLDFEDVIQPTPTSYSHSIEFATEKSQLIYFSYKPPPITKSIYRLVESYLL